RPSLSLTISSLLFLIIFVLIAFPLFNHVRFLLLLPLHLPLPLRVPILFLLPLTLLLPMSARGAGRGILGVLARAPPTVVPHLLVGFYNVGWTRRGREGGGPVRSG